MPSPGDGTVVAEIQIPAIGVDQYVVKGPRRPICPKARVTTSEPRCPDRRAMSPSPAIERHTGPRSTAWASSCTGDRIILTTTSGQHLTYVVSGTPQAVSPSDVAVLNYFGDNRITLTTCTPEFSASQRLVVVGMLKQPLASVRRLHVKHLSYHVVNPATVQLELVVAPGRRGRGLPPASPRAVVPAV